MLAASEATLESAIIGLLLVALIAFAVYALCTYAFRRPDIGRPAAAVIAVIGGILVLLSAV